MNKYKQLSILFSSLTILLTNSYAGQIKDDLNLATQALKELKHEIKHNKLDILEAKSSLKTLASQMTHLSPQELNRLKELIFKETKDIESHKHISTRVSTKETSPKIENHQETKISDILTALGALAAKEGTDSACKFCSAILADVTVNKVEVVDMAQDWIQLRIKKGDNLSNFAKKYYGEANKFKIIANSNKNTLGANNTIYAGNTLIIPRRESLKKQNEKTSLSCKFCAALLADSSLAKIKLLNVDENYVEVKIRRGDMLSRLALKYYGKASAYSLIYEANRDKIGKNYLIYPGTTLRIPKVN